MILSISMHEHAAVLHSTDPPDNGVTDSTIHVDVDDISEDVSV